MSLSLASHTTTQYNEHTVHLVIPHPRMDTVCCRTDYCYYMYRKIRSIHPPPCTTFVRNLGVSVHSEFVQEIRVYAHVPLLCIVYRKHALTLAGMCVWQYPVYHRTPSKRTVSARCHWGKKKTVEWAAQDIRWHKVSTNRSLHVDGTNCRAGVCMKKILTEYEWVQGQYWPIPAQTVKPWGQVEHEVGISFIAYTSGPFFSWVGNILCIARSVD